MSDQVSEAAIKAAEQAERAAARKAERAALGHGERLISLYTLASEKRSGLDGLMWQVPGLSITAQAFLLTIALGPETRWAGRFAAAGLGCFVAWASVQLLLKQRLHEQAHSEWLEAVEDWAGLPALHPPRRLRRMTDGADSVKSGFLSPTRYRSHRVWVFVLSLFGVVDVLVVALGILHACPSLHVWNFLGTPANGVPAKP